MTAELKRPGWLEIIVGVVAFFLLLIPTAVMVGYLQDQPVLQGVVASTGGGTAGLGAFLLVYLLRVRSLAVFGFKSVSLRWLLAGAGLAVVGYGLSLLIQYGWLHFVGADQSQSVLHNAAQAGALALHPVAHRGSGFDAAGRGVPFSRGRGQRPQPLRRMGRGLV